MIRWLALLGLWLVALPALADFRIQTANPHLSHRNANERLLAVNARATLALSAATEEALHNGIPLEIVIDIEFIRQRWWWANKIISDWSLRRRLSFHTLSRRYLVSGYAVMDSPESFTSLHQALAHIGNLGLLETMLTPKKQIDPGTRHLMRLRMRLDIEALPSLLRPLAYTNPAWRLNSGWTTWPVQP